MEKKNLDQLFRESGALDEETFLKEYVLKENGEAPECFGSGAPYETCKVCPFYAKC